MSLRLVSEGVLHEGLDCFWQFADLAEHLHGGLVGAAVEGALEGGDGAGDGAVHVGECAGDDASGEGAGVVVVLGVEDEGDIDDAGFFVGGLAPRIM
jgi:hypothetical protein